jgi:pimeloyl-ACP methyl ester carboxylesterase
MHPTFPSIEASARTPADHPRVPRGRRRARNLAVAAVLAVAAAAAAGYGASSLAPTTRAVASVSKAPVAVATAPVHVISTGRGDVAYRSVGSGPPLVLIMGLGSSMEDWAPSLVDRLARTHRVVIFDNAGIGMTAALPGTLTMSAMADQTSALIAALGLGRPDVLGWSMGGLIAQALVVRHRNRVHRLVLAATQPGNGKAKPIPADVQKILATATAEQFLALLFPADQQAAEKAYADGIGRYADRATVPDAVFGAQSAALHGWLDGSEAAGHKVTSSTVRTLIADGRKDAFNPLPNSRMLAKLFHRSTLQLYADAGHAFLFQDHVKFADSVNAFLAAKP